MDGVFLNYVKVIEPDGTRYDLNELLGAYKQVYAEIAEDGTILGSAHPGASIASGAKAFSFSRGAFKMGPSGRLGTIPNGAYQSGEFFFADLSDKSFTWSPSAGAKNVTASPVKDALLAKRNRRGQWLISKNGGSAAKLLTPKNRNENPMKRTFLLLVVPMCLSSSVHAQQAQAAPVASASKWDEAENRYTRAIALNPKEPKAYLDRGRIRGERKRFALAIDDVTVALALLGLAQNSTPRAVSAAYASRASYWLGLGEPRRALIDALVATEADPDSSGARLGKADAYYALGELDEANLHLIQAQVLDFKIKRSYTASGAEKNARKNGRLDGKRDTDPLFQAATSAQQEGKLKEAIEGYTAVLALDPGIANAWWNRALAQLKTGDLAAALADSSTYIALAGRSSDKTDQAKALRFRASVYMRLSRYREAVSDLEWAVKLKPDEPKNAAQLKTARETLAAQPSGAPSPQER